MQIPKRHKKRKKEKIKTTTMHVVTQAFLFFFPNFVIQGLGFTINPKPYPHSGISQIWAAFSLKIQKSCYILATPSKLLSKYDNFEKKKKGEEKNRSKFGDFGCSFSFTENILCMVRHTTQISFVTKWQNFAQRKKKEKKKG